MKDIETQLKQELHIYHMRPEDLAHFDQYGLVMGRILLEFCWDENIFRKFLEYGLYPI